MSETRTGDTRPATTRGGSTSTTAPQGSPPPSGGATNGRPAWTNEERASAALTASATPEAAQDQLARRDLDAAVSKASQGTRTPAEIEREIEVTRVRLANTVDDIATRVKPKNVAMKLLDRAKAQFVQPNGELRTERVAAVGGGLAAFLALVVVGRVRGRHRAEARQLVVPGRPAVVVVEKKKPKKRG